jgi:hypothetical protein
MEKALNERMRSSTKHESPEALRKRVGKLMEKF